MALEGKLILRLRPPGLEEKDFPEEEYEEIKLLLGNVGSQIDTQLSDIEVTDTDSENEDAKEDETVNVKNKFQALQLDREED